MIDPFARIDQTAADMELPRQIIKDGQPVTQWGYIGLRVAEVGTLALMTCGMVDGSVYLMRDNAGYTLLTGSVASIARTIIEERC